MDYGTLKTTLASYLHRDDLTATIPTFITLAQARMSHDLDLTSMHAVDTLTVTAATNEVTLPVDFLEMLSLRIPDEGGYRLLQQRSLAGNSQVLDNGGATGEPVFYARYGNVIELTPVPSASTTLNIIYKKRFTAFSLDADTDDVLTYTPNIYIYGAMLEAMPFLKDANAPWQEMYMGEVSRLNDLAYNSQWSGGPMQITNLGTDTP